LMMILFRNIMIYSFLLNYGDKNHNLLVPQKLFSSAPLLVILKCSLCLDLMDSNYGCANKSSVFFISPQKMYDLAVNLCLL
jgi:hypothetical protein